MGEPSSLEEQLYNKFQTMNVSDKDVNILLLGETGVGKSTFINAFANYLEYKNFDIAEENKVRCLIPAKFTVTNEKFEEKVVLIGSDDNENSTMSASATLETRSYVFPLNRDGINRIRLIDTPGIGDTRGIDRDNENMENILSYISHLEELHAICFLLKPNNARLTVMFHYCIKQLLSRLEKSASRNVIFLFTNTRSTFYKPGDTTTALKTILNSIKSKPPFVDIQFMKDNVFCLDNESFRYTVAVKSGILLGNKESFAESWNHSVKECWRMIHFITGQGDSNMKIVPHKVKSTLSVNEARRLIIQLSKPLADIAELINDNITALDRHKKSLNTDNATVAQLKANMYVPVVNLRLKELSQPTTVCTAAKCSEIYTVRDIKKYHYKQRCHDPCYLTNVPREIIGSPEIVNCAAMSSGKCQRCSCDFTTHMHIYYMSETYDDKIDNEGVKAQIKDRETALDQTKKTIAKVEARKLAYESEKETIIKTMAKFAHFLQHNAIAPYNDAYQAYIEYLVDREKSNGADCDFEMIRYYEELLRRYGEEKRILENALSSASGGQAVTAEAVFNSVKTLYNLPNSGQQIRELHDKQTKSQTKEHGNTEIVLESTQNTYTAQTKNNNNKKKNKNQQQQNQQKQNPTRNKNKKGQFDSRATSAHGRGQRNLQNQSNPQAFYQNQRFPLGHGYGPNYQGYHPGYFPNQHFGGPPVFQNYGGQPNYQGHQNNYPSQSRFPNQNQQQRFNPNNSGYAGMPGQGNEAAFDEWMKSSGHFSSGSSRNFSFGSSSGNDFQNNPQSTTKDPKFDDWLENVMGNNNDGTNLPSRQYNDLSTRQVSSDESENSNESDATEPDDAEDFKDFMIKNNLEYMIKSSNKKSFSNYDISDKTSGSYDDMSKFNDGNMPRNNDSNVRDYNKGRQYEARNNDAYSKENKGMLKNFFGKFL